ncbi:unannotated protein [freshwater metagenome]|uniref:Unannotated protein n=1 Tax=freshwater metagenome TaxID=449393 RepID=A0A6J7TQX9_9ZZZZ
MEGLAYLVTILLMIVILGGPVAILLTKIRTEHIVLTIIRRLLHGLVITLALFISSTVIWKANQNLALDAMAIFGISMAYIALRREYFSDVRIIAPILAKFGVKLWKKQKRSGSEQGSSHFGPLMKWRRGGHSGGNDGHGPEGQH